VPLRCAVNVMRACQLLRRQTSNTSSESVATTTGRRSEEHTSELQSLAYLVCRLLLEKKKYPVNFVLLVTSSLFSIGAGTLFSHVDILAPSDVGSTQELAFANQLPAALSAVANIYYES